MQKKTQSELSSLPNSQVKSASFGLPVNTKSAIGLAERVQDALSQFMPNEKHTTHILEKVASLVTALRKCIISLDIDTSPAYIKILEEVKENLKELQYYINDFQKRNAITKKYFPSFYHYVIQIKRELNQTQNDGDRLELIESLAIMQRPNIREFDADENSEESKDLHQYQGAGQRKLSNHYEKRLQSKIQEFEQKLKFFLKQQDESENYDYQHENKMPETNRIIQHQKGERDNQHPRISNIGKDRGTEHKLSDVNDGQNNTNSEGNGGQNSNDENISRGLQFSKAQEYCLEAMCLLYGHGIEPNTEDAILWFERSAKLGEPQALNALGHLHEKGIGNRINMVKAIQYYQKAADLNDSAALFRLGQLYLEGGQPDLNEGKPDAVRTFQLYQRAAKYNSKEALRELGFIFEKGGLIQGKNGEFVQLSETDIEKAVQVFEQAASQGDELAMNYLGSYHFNYTKDYRKAVNLFRQASEKGTCARALNNLGSCFEMGVEGSEQDYTQAMKLYEQSAKQGHTQAMVNLAFLYFKIASSSNQAFPDTYDCYFECANWLRMALDKDDSLKEANLLMGQLYEEGLAVDSNFKYALKYFKKSASLGCAKAYTKLGHLYYTGLNNTSEVDMMSSASTLDFTVYQSKEEAFEQYQKASDLGDSESCNCLGLMFESGFANQSPDPQKAAECYKKGVAIDGNSDAILNLGLLYFNDLDEPLQSEGLSLIRQATDKGNVRAKEFLVVNDLVFKRNNFFNHETSHPDTKIQDNINDRATMI